MKKIALLLILLFLCSCSTQKAKDKPDNFSRIPNQSIAAAYSQYLLYASCKDDGYSLVRSDLDGGNEIDLAKHDRSWPSNISIMNDWVYYEVADAAHKVKIDGSGYQEITSNAKHMNVVGDWIFYLQGISYPSGSDTVSTKYSIRKIRTDGTQDQLVIDEDVRGLTVLNHYIYYLSFAPDRQTLCRISADGTEKAEILSDENVLEMYICGNAIFCIRSYYEGFSVFSVDLDGKNKTELNFSATKLYTYEDSVYFSDSHYETTPYKLKKYDISTGNITEVLSLTEDKIGSDIVYVPGFRNLSIVNDRIYFGAAIESYSKDTGAPIFLFGFYRCDIGGENLVVLSYREEL